MELVPAPEGAPKNFSEEYRSYVFRFWYTNSKRGAIYVLDNIPIKIDWVTGSELTRSQVNSWIYDRFTEYAEYLDEEVTKKFDQQMIEERVIMLTRHADEAQKLQKWAMEYIEEEGLETARNAVTALVQGIKIERESRGLPMTELLALKDKTDAELVATLRDMVKESNILELEPAEVEDDDSDA